MKFEKKIIVGSIMSFAATVVGVIAIFFPDLFNLQKEKMEKLELTISNRQDAETFAKFISEREKDGKLFEINVFLGVLPWDKYRNETDTQALNEEPKYKANHIIWESHSFPNQSFGYTLYSNYGESKQLDENMEFYVNNLKDDKDFSDAYDENLDCLSDMDTVCIGSSYFFPAKSMKVAFEDTLDDLHDANSVARIKGYFMINTDKTEEFMGHKSIYLQDIPKEQVQLKNY